MLKQFFLNDTVITVLVLLNTLVIFLGGLYQEDYIITLLDDVFTIMFIVEAVVKIKKMTWKRYWYHSWNRLDFIVLLFAIPSLLNFFLTRSNSHKCDTYFPFIPYF